MEECDDTASSNDESRSENVDSDINPNYSLSFDSYSDSSDKNRTSLHEVNVCALNGTQMEIRQQKKTEIRKAEKKESFNHNKKFATKYKKQIQIF